MKYATIRIEGPILSADILDRIEQGDTGGQSPKDFGLDGRAKVKGEIVRAWADAKDLWQVFSHRMERVKDGESGTSETRRFFMVPFLGLLGYEVETARAETVNGKSYAISHRAVNRDGFPVHITGFNDSLDKKRETGGPRMSPHALVQEYLNLTEHLYALAANGLHLRLLRNSSRLVKLSFVEFDLERMFSEDHYADFAVLYRLLHASRTPLKKDAGAECILERYHQDALDAGSRIRDGLSEAVKYSIISLADGFLAHDDNGALREALERGALKPEELYHQLLRLIYRVLFLMVTEERGLVFAPKTPPERRAVYMKHYSLDRLRALSDRAFLHDRRYKDLWECLLRTFALFEEGGKGEPLGIKPLAGELFHFRSIGTLSECSLDNEALLSCVRNLNVFINKNTGQATRVNYGSLSVEEFGSVYEGMLDFHAVVVTTGGKQRFDLVSGKERKTTGSYYTPPELVAELIKSALEPVVKERLAKKPPPGLPLQKGEGKSSPENGVRTIEETILNIKVCDPACGSGHFLLAAARYLARELAMARTGGDEASPEELRRALREVIGRCIYGVDKNPLAVELCKVALWIEGHEPGKPLSFLDHRIKCGDSLVGVMDIEAVSNTGIPDEAFKPVTGDDKEIAKELKKRNKSFADAGQGNLFSGGQKDTAALAKEAAAIAAMGDESLASVKAKEERYRKLHVQDGLYSREYTLCSLWTAAFFIPMTRENKINKRLVTNDEFFRYLRNEQVPESALAYVRALSLDQRFFHWPIEFPEVFARGGFDCVLGNPPWELLELKDNVSETDSFARMQKWFKSGQYSILNGRRDLYKLFLINCTNLLSSKGLYAFLTPLGVFMEDEVSKWRKDFFNNGSVTHLFHYQNAKHIFFPKVHASYRFCAVTYSPSESFDHKFSTVAESSSAFYSRYIISVKRKYFSEWLGEDCSGTIYSTKEYAILHQFLMDKIRKMESLKYKVVAEFHASTDKNILYSEPKDKSWIVPKNRNIHFFNYKYASPDTWVSFSDVKERVKRKGLISTGWTDRYPRLLFRDIARNDDERTLISCLVPPGVVSTYDTPMFVPNCRDEDYPLWICFFGALFSSILFDFLIRSFVDKHIKGYTLARINWPSPLEFLKKDTLFDRITALMFELAILDDSYSKWARDCNYHGTPFPPNPERKFISKCELDACIFRLILGENDNWVKEGSSELLSYFPSPKHAIDFIFETFPIMKRKDEEIHGIYKTKEQVLEKY